MSVALAALMLAADPVPPPGLVFGYYRMLAFQMRSRASHCGTGDLDRELDMLRDRLAKRFDAKPFHPSRQPPPPPGDCQTIVTVYRVNLADFSKEAEAALAVPPVAAATPAEG